MKELGEDVLPEPAAASVDSAQTTTVDSAVPPPNEHAALETTVPKTEGAAATDGAAAEEAAPADAEAKVTTEERKPLKVPDTVHVRITPENLKEYVGPPVYHRDRMFTKPPPPGVSTGLGYLGNGSGAVMPIEATVRRRVLAGSFAILEMLTRLL